MTIERKGFTNEYKIIGDTTEIYIVRRNGDKFTALIDTEDLPRLIKLNLSWHVRYDKATNEYYVRATKIIYGEDDKKIGQKIILLQRFIMNAFGKVVVDHHNHNRLDNRKNNLYVTEHSNNSTNRKGANKNNGTGARNVNYGKGRKAYWVQFCKEGKRYKWVFPLNQFKEACEFAEKKRKELYGEFAGRG